MSNNDIIDSSQFPNRIPRNLRIKMLLISLVLTIAFFFFALFWYKLGFEYNSIITYLDLCFILAMVASIIGTVTGVKFLKHDKKKAIVGLVGNLIILSIHGAFLFYSTTTEYSIISMMALY